MQTRRAPILVVDDDQRSLFGRPDPRYAMGALAAAAVSVVGCSSNEAHGTYQPDSGMDGGADGDLDATDAGDAPIASDASDANNSSDASDANNSSDASDANNVSEAGDSGSGCTASGGTVGTSRCCTSTGDFPNNCLVGACGCSPSNSHAVNVCNCPMGKCFNGIACR
jgi:hypothetical protein